MCISKLPSWPLALFFLPSVWLGGGRAQVGPGGQIAARGLWRRLTWPWFEEDEGSSPGSPASRGARCLLPSATWRSALTSGPRGDSWVLPAVSLAQQWLVTAGWAPPCPRGAPLPPYPPRLGCLPCTPLVQCLRHGTPPRVLPDSEIVSNPGERALLGPLQPFPTTALNETLTRAGRAAGRELD